MYTVPVVNSISPIILNLILTFIDRYKGKEPLYTEHVYALLFVFLHYTQAQTIIWFLLFILYQKSQYGDNSEGFLFSLLAEKIFWTIPGIVSK